MCDMNFEQPHGNFSAVYIFTFTQNVTNENGGADKAFG